MHFGVYLWSQSEIDLQQYSAKLAFIKPLFISDLSSRISVMTLGDIPLSFLV